MTSLTKFRLLLAFLLQTTVQQQKVEGVVWFGEAIIGLEKMKETVNFLNGLKLITANDSTTENQIMVLIKQISANVDYFGDVERSNDLDKKFPTKWDRTIFLENIGEIKARYEWMKEVSQTFDKNESWTRKMFSKFNVSPGSTSVFSIISNVFSEYLGISFGGLPKRASLVNAIATEFHDAERNHLCLKNSAQQYFFNDYWNLSILSIQAYLISKFSWTFLRDKSLDFFRSEEENFLREHKLRTESLNSILIDNMSKATMEIRTCDPLNWEEGVNYEQLTRLIQGYITNEMNLNPYNSCYQTCQYYKNETVTCYEEDGYCQKDRSTGNVISCESDFGYNEIFVCPSESRTRRYQFFQTISSLVSSNDKYYGIGNRDSCQSTYGSHVFSYPNGVFYCSYCFCLLDEKSDKSDRFFNLREVVSDIDENKVVTGVRFLKKNRVMYLQIQQGELAPIGFIKKNTTAWKDVEEYELNEQNNGVDYFTFDNKQRSIDLESIQILNSSYVVTGVKLSVRSSRLYLKVRFTQCDLRLGKLIQPQSSSDWVFDYFLNEDKLPLGRENEAPNVSTLARGTNVPSPDFYDYVEFTHSNKKTDASQTTLPFFDSQNVVSDSPTPLSGIGLYHRGFDGYGGFIAPKIFTPNFHHLLTLKKSV